MVEHNIQIENVFLRIFDNAAEIDVSPADVHFVCRRKLNTLKVLHTHPYYEFFVCVKRPTVIGFGSFSQEIRPDDIIIVPPGVEHVLISENDCADPPSLHVAISRKQGGSKDLFSEIYSFMAQNSPILISDRPAEADRLSRLIHESKKDENDYLAVSAAELIISLTRLPSRILSESVGCSGRVIKEKALDMETSSALENLVASKFMTDITSSEAAAMMHLSVRQFDRIMKKHYGQSFRQTVTLRRLMVAVELFKTTDLSIEDISNEVGFSSRAGFSKAFELQYGMTPSKYRRIYCGKKRSAKK